MNSIDLYISGDAQQQLQNVVLEIDSLAKREGCVCASRNLVLMGAREVIHRAIDAQIQTATDAAIAAARGQQ